MYNSIDDCMTDSMYSSRSTLTGHKRTSEGDGKERIQINLVPILFVRIHTSMGKSKPKTIQILWDLGASTSPIFKLKYFTKLGLKCNKTTTRTTAAGNFTNQEQ
jgi:hypothetical protein